MSALSFLFKCRYQRIAVWTVLACGLALYGAPTAVFAQNDGGARDNHEDGASTGGNWKVLESEDPMTAAKRVTFEIVSNNSSKEDRYSRSKITLYCENGKFKRSEFTPDSRLAPPNRPGFWGQPQMEVMVRVDDRHDYHGWNWNGRFLAMDKGTTRELIGAQIFRIEFGARRGGPEIAEFSPSGLDLSRVSHACGLTPKKP